MAVYKSTHCYPFMNNIDIRTALSNASSEDPYQILTCKVDTSNKNATGYSIRILDEDNNVIFPVDSNPKISPISELQDWLYESNGVNSGINGTYLKIPFFQSKDNPIYSSYNAIYYTPKYNVDHLIASSDLIGSTNPFADPANWEKDGDNNYYKYTWPSGTEIEKIKNKISLDGEIILEGQVILVANNSYAIGDIPSGFYRVIKVIDTSLVPGKEINATRLALISNWSVDGDFKTTILKGKSYHNKIISKENSVYAFDSTGILYKDISNNNILKLITGSTLYKWEITLYQGDYIKTGNPSYCDYSSTDNNNYDMVLTSGTILGSNNNRIQIAYNDAFDSNGVGLDCDLPKQKEGVLVLQGKYIDFGTNTSSLFSNHRAYVRNYDSSYGHVYPLDGSVIMETVSTNDYAQFFKLSNDPDAILETDKIQWGTSAQTSFVYLNENHDDYESYNNFMNLPINKRIYGILKSSLQDISPSLKSIEAGQKILFTNMDRSYQNGVYEVYERSDLSPSTYVIFLKRVSPYNKWGTYIGKVFYVESYVEAGGTLTARNIESLAGSNPDASLWNPDTVSTGSGSSNLYFTEEMPILLFGDKIADNHYFDVYEHRNTTIPSPWTWDSNTKIDGISVFNGMKILVTVAITEGGTTTYTVKRYVAEGSSSGTITLVGDWDTTNDYAYVYQGENFGKRVLSITGATSNPEISWRLHTAKILKNATNYTYISPFLDIKENMKLKLTGNNYATLSDLSKTQWLKINKVNNSLYCILHESLASSLVSEVSSYNNTPWKYEIRSFFKSSDFNPFYCYETPYLILYKNNTEYSGMLNTATQEEFFVNKSDNSTSIPYYTIDDQNNEYQFIVGTYQDSGTTYSKPLKLSAKYIQGEGLSWESYRWILLDKDGNILQDTGKKYDKELSVIFYGLSSDDINDSFSTYYAVLYVEDEINNILNYSVKLTIEKGESPTSKYPFKATYDCGLHAVKLIYSGNSNVIASYRNNTSYIDELYIPASDGWDGGISYVNDEGFEVKYKQGLEASALVDYSSGSNITKSNGLEYSSYFSLGTISGIPYYKTFNNTNSIQSTDGGAPLIFPPINNSSGGELYFETEYFLNDNYCGTILEWFIEGENDSSGVEDLYVDKNNGMPNLGGYLSFRLKTQDNFTLNNLNNDRNKLTFEITAYPVGSGSGISQEVDSNNFILFNILNSRKYYLQEPGKLTDANKEDNEFLNFELTYDLFLQKDKNGKFFAGTSLNPFHNLSLAESSSTGCVSYWVEDRPFIINDNTDRDYFLFNSSETYNYQMIADKTRVLNTDTNTNLLKWPSETGDYKESDYIWDDIDSSSYSYEKDLPMKWGDITVEDQSNFIKEIVAAEKHYNIHKDYYLLCKINNVEAIYNTLISSNPNNFLSIDDTSTEATITIGDNLGTIQIIKKAGD